MVLSSLIMPISNYIVIFKIYNNVWTVTIIYGICCTAKELIIYVNT